MPSTSALHECCAQALALQVHRPAIIRRFQFGEDADAIAKALGLDRRYVDAVISLWWHKTAATRRGPLPLKRRAA